MNYLTNYYRNLCEQLQEKLNILEAQINEGRYNPDTGRLEIRKEFVPDKLFGPNRKNPFKSTWNSKRTPEQQKAIEELEAIYRPGSQNSGKIPSPRPYDPDRKEDVRYFELVRRTKEEPEPKEKEFVPRYPTLQPNINPKSNQFEADPSDPAGFRDPKINLQKSIPLRFLLSDKYPPNIKKTPEVK